MEQSPECNARASLHISIGDCSRNHLKSINISMASENSLPMYECVHDYLWNMEALTHKEAKKKWRQSIKDIWNNQCAYCGKPPIDDSSLTLDHVRAKCKGGEDLSANIVPADWECNASKGSEDWRDWFRRQDFYEEWREDRIDYWLAHGRLPKE